MGTGNWNELGKNGLGGKSCKIFQKEIIPRSIALFTPRKTFREHPRLEFFFLHFFEFLLSWVDDRKTKAMIENFFKQTYIDLWRLDKLAEIDVKEWLNNSRNPINFAREKKTQKAHD